MKPNSMKKKTIKLRPEIVYPCNFCSVIFYYKRDLLSHLKDNRCSNFLSKDFTSYNFVFLKPV